MDEEKASTKHQSPIASPTRNPAQSNTEDKKHPKVKSIFARLGNLPQWKLAGKQLSGSGLNWGIASVSSLAFLMLGYDQGVLSGLLTLDDFQKVHTLMTPLDESNPLCWTEAGPPNRDFRYCHGTANIQAAGVAVYQIGNLIGGILILFYGERWGRRSSTFWGSLIMIIGTIMQAASFEFGLFVTGRVVSGIGNGMVSSTIPTWQSECARPEKRGFLLMVCGAVITFGIAVAYWTVYGFYFLQGSVRWRFPLMFQSFFTILGMIGLLFLPDSPRWLLMRGRVDEARNVQARLLGKEEDHPEVVEEMNAVAAALGVEGKTSGGVSFRTLLRSGPEQNLRRTLLGIAAQFCQQMTGINLITYYATFVIETSLGFGPELSRLLGAANGTEYFLASLLAIPLIERVGRRKLMLFGSVGMLASMAILAGVTSTGTTTETGAPQLSTAYGVTAVVFLFGFNSFFAIGWLGMGWLYPAEITNLTIRIRANALSTCANWLGNFLIVMITPPAFANLQWRTYIIFAVFNAAIIPIVYFFFPETAKRSLEEIDLYFAKAHEEGDSPVKMAKKMPRFRGEQLDDELTKYFGNGDEEAATRRRSSLIRRSV